MPAIIRSTATTVLALTMLAGPLVGLGSAAGATTSAHETFDVAQPDKTAKLRTKDKQKQKRKRAAKISKRIDAKVSRARSIALNQTGDPYSYGASGPNAFDCSGLVKYAYARAGLALPRTSSAQAGAVRHIPKQRLQPGDLMFFTGSGGVYHAAIFLRWERGHAVMVHSPGTGRSVTVAAPWTSSWFAGTVRR